MNKNLILLFSTFIIFNTSLADSDLRHSMKISSKGMEVQGKRLKIVAQNLANKDSTGTTPGEKPYQRQIIMLNTKKDRSINGKKVFVKKITTSKTPFKKIFDPSHPAANDEGYVLYPNVDSVIENADSKDAMRSYEANLNMIDTAKNMFLKTIEVIK